MIITAFDTETSGLCDHKKPLDWGGHGRLMQLGAVQFEVIDGVEGWTEVNSVNLLVQPDPNMELHPKAFEAHGISIEKANKFGVLLESALDVFADLLATSDMLMAYNIEFDKRCMAAEYARNLRVSWEEVTGGMQEHCAMKPMTEVCKLPAPWGHGYKWPKLEEAYEHCFDKKLEGAHDATVDVRATIEVFMWWTQLKNVA